MLFQRNDDLFAISKNPTFNLDADGCREEFYNVGAVGVLLFDVSLHFAVFYGQK